MASARVHVPFFTKVHDEQHFAPARFVFVKAVPIALTFERSISLLNVNHVLVAPTLIVETRAMQRAP